MIFPSETSLVKACLVFLKSQGAMAWRVNAGAMRMRAPGRRDRFIRFNSRQGISDICGVYRGRALFIEAKRHPNRLTEHQAQFLEEAKAQGAFAICVWSLSELEEAFREAFTV